MSGQRQAGPAFQLDWTTPAGTECGQVLVGRDAEEAGRRGFATLADACLEAVLVDRITGEELARYRRPKKA